MSRELSLFFTSRVKTYRLPSSKDIFLSIVAFNVAVLSSLCTSISTSKGSVFLGRSIPFVLFKPRLSASDSTGSNSSEANTTSVLSSASPPVHGIPVSSPTIRAAPDEDILLMVNPVAYSRVKGITFSLDGATLNTTNAHLRLKVAKVTRRELADIVTPRTKDVITSSL